MSRLRTIKPGFFLDDELAECRPLARLLFAGLWTIADRDGRLKDRPRKIKAETLPYDDCDVNELLHDLATHGSPARFIIRYSVEECPYIAIPSWGKHQSPHVKEAPSTIPAPDEYQTSMVLSPYEPPSSCLSSCLGSGLEEPPLPPRPVDNFAEPERGCSIEPAEPSPEPSGDSGGDGSAASHHPTTSNHETCDGKPCAAHDFPASAFAPLRRAMLTSLHPEQQKAVGTHGDLDALLGVYAAHVCAACQAAFGEFERPQRDGICEQAVVAAVANLHGSQDVAAVMKSRMLHYGLADLIGDRKLEDLRRTKRDKRRKSEARRVGEVIVTPERAVAP